MRRSLTLWTALSFAALSLGCSAPPLYPSEQLTLRLARTWRPSYWEVIGALRGRGPLRVALWSVDEFKRRGLSVRAWVNPETLTQLKIEHDWSALGEPLLYDEPLTLDGVGARLALRLYLPRNQERARFPRRFDLVVPLREVAERFSAHPTQLKRDLRGWIRVDPLPEAPSNHDHLDRFARWLFTSAYKDQVIGARVDRDGEILIKWRRPQIQLPPDLWILVDIAPLGAPAEALRVWLESESVSESSSPIVKSTTSRLNATVSSDTRLTVDAEIRLSGASTERRVSACTYKAPCPVRALDVIHYATTCHHDICTYRETRSPKASSSVNAP